MPRLIVKSEGVHVAPMELKLGITRLGRTASNDFQIDHPTLSGRHCEIVLLNGSVTVRDCDSTNGTYIDGQPIQEATLQAGQILHLGEVELALDDTPANVAIPEMKTLKRASALPNGLIACVTHPDVRAVYQCTQCQRVLCEACIHKLRRIGGKLLKLCPECSGPCELLPGFGPKKKKWSMLDLLRKTLKMPTRRK